jgi:hypothetical protein
VATALSAGKATPGQQHEFVHQWVLYRSALKGEPVSIFVSSADVSAPLPNASACRLVCHFGTLDTLLL